MSEARPASDVSALACVGIRVLADQLLVDALDVAGRADGSFAVLYPTTQDALGVVVVRPLSAPIGWEVELDAIIRRQPDLTVIAIGTVDLDDCPSDVIRCDSTISLVDLVAHIRANAPALVEDVPRLTARELQVLKLLAAGHNAPALAHTLQISVHTAHTHLKALRKKFGASNAIEVVASATRHAVL